MKPGTLLRILYVDLVRRRSTVRVLPASTDQLDTKPIFLLGLYRSGTTLLRYVVDSHPEIACPPETDYMGHLRGLVFEERAARGLESLGYDSDHVAQQLAGLADYFHGNYARSRGKVRWADKSPTYVDHIDLLQRMFPQARFVCIHRNPLDQVHSHTRGGSFTHEPVAEFLGVGEDPRLGAARYWAAKTALLHARQEDAAFLSIRYEDLCREPELVTRALAVHMGVAWSREMLEFGAVQHDFGAEAARTRSTSGFTISSGHWKDWPPDVTEEVWRIVDPVARALDYAWEAGVSEV